MYWELPGQRQFDVNVEEKTFKGVDVVALAESHRKAFTLEIAQIVSDGFVSIEVTDSNPKIDQGKLSAIQIKLVGPHLAHSVIAGPVRQRRRSFHDLCVELLTEYSLVSISR